MNRTPKSPEEELQLLRSKQVKCREYIQAARQALALLQKCLEHLDKELADVYDDTAVYSDTYFRTKFPRGVSTEQDYDRLIADIAAIPSYHSAMNLWEDPIVALTDRPDQMHILQDMKAAHIPLKSHLGSLFKHVSNIQSVFDEKSIPLPQWYQEKYRFWVATSK